MFKMFLTSPLIDRHVWYNQDGVCSACYHCRVVREGQFWQVNECYLCSQQLTIPLCDLLSTNASIFNILEVRAIQRGRTSPISGGV